MQVLDYSVYHQNSMLLHRVGHDWSDLAAAAVAIGIVEEILWEETWFLPGVILM